MTKDELKTVAQKNILEFECVVSDILNRIWTISSRYIQKEQSPKILKEVFYYGISVFCKQKYSFYRKDFLETERKHKKFYHEDIKEYVSEEAFLVSYRKKIARIKGDANRYNEGFVTFYNLYSDYKTVLMEELGIEEEVLIQAIKKAYDYINERIGSLFLESTYYHVFYSNRIHNYRDAVNAYVFFEDLYVAHIIAPQRRNAFQAYAMDYIEKIK